MTTDKRPALGKGLSALIPDAPAPAARTSPVELDIDRLTPNTYQPRGQFDDGRLEELAKSIKANGVIQPIVVRKVGDQFHIIAGERRWRAAKRAGLQTIPCVVREIGNDSSLEQALVENLHRQDLNPLEEAAAYQQLLEDFGLSHDDLSRRVGKSRSAVSNTLRLFKLPPAIQRMVAEGRLSAHAVTTLHYLATRARGRTFGEQCVRDVTSIFAVSPVDGAVVAHALALGFADFEDAVTAAAAEADGCGAVVSRDADGFRNAPLAVLDAEAALTAIRVRRAHE